MNQNRTQNTFKKGNILIFVNKESILFRIVLLDELFHFNIAYNTEEPFRHEGQKSCSCYAMHQISKRSVFTKPQLFEAVPCTFS